MLTDRVNSAVRAVVLFMGVTALMGGTSSSADAAPILQQTSPVATLYTEFVDFDVMTYSALADVTALVTAVAPTAMNSGCDPAHFAGFTAGNIALISRSPNVCTFELKAENAAAAGAVGVLIFNTDPSLLFPGALQGGGTQYTGGIPVFGLTGTLGQALLQSTAPITMRMFNDEPIPGAVPEPATLLLLSSGMAVAAYRRRCAPRL